MKARAVSTSIAWLLCFCLTMPAVAQSGPQTQSAPPSPAATDSTTNTQQSTDSTASSPANNTSDIATTAPNVRSGSKNDVDAIGNRNVGGRALRDGYSNDTESKMATQYERTV